MGVTLESVDNLQQVSRGDRCDAILASLTPRGKPLLGQAEAELIAQRWPEAVVVQYVGDIERAALRAAGLTFWPLEAPPAGHMGILPSAVGPEPVVNLQVGGLKVGEMLWRARRKGADSQQAVQACVESGYGQALEGCEPAT
jgi:hypothetical protein